MKRFVNLFYTSAFKFFVFSLSVIFSWCAISETYDVFKRFYCDGVSAKNVFIQWDGFDYAESEHLKSEIEATIENVLLNSLKYKSEKYTNSSKAEYDDTALDYYLRISDEDYKKNIEYLESLRYVDYAVVNHDSNTIISNINEVDGKSSGFDVRRYFGKNDENLLVVLNAKNPSYETGTMTEYIDFVSSCAEDYKEDFDLYINFKNNFVFRYDIEHYENLHNSMKKLIVSDMTLASVFFLLYLIFTVLYVCLSGKVEQGGRITHSAHDRIPNDLKLLSILVTALSLMALYNNSIYMLFRSSHSDGDYLLGISPGYYELVAKICFVLLTNILLAVICIIKRQLYFRTLFSNTYICRFIEAVKQNKKH